MVQDNAFDRDPETFVLLQEPSRGFDSIILKKFSICLLARIISASCPSSGEEHRVHSHVKNNSYELSVASDRNVDQSSTLAASCVISLVITLFPIMNHPSAHR